MLSARKYSLIAVSVTALCLSGCTTPSPQTTRQEAPKPQVKTTHAPTIDGSKLWHASFAPLETSLIERIGADQTPNKEDVLTLSKLAQMRYNSALASYSQPELRKHIEKGEIDSRIAMQGYLKAGLPKTAADYAILLRRLGLFEEKLGQYPEAIKDLNLAIASATDHFTLIEVFEMKMDLARVYMEAREDKKAALLLEELLTAYKNRPSLTDSETVLLDNYVKAHERLNDPKYEKEIAELKATSAQLKRMRSERLQREAEAALETEK